MSINSKVLIFVVLLHLFPDNVIGQEIVDIDYRRSSLYSLMLTEENRLFEEIIKQTFLETPIPTKFNDHNLEERSIVQIPYSEDSEAINRNVFTQMKAKLGGNKKQKKALERKTIEDFLERNEIAKKIVSKWFQRDSRGGFSIDLVVERGLYDASQIDISISKNSQLGSTLLADAGEELITNTFVVINDFQFIDKKDIVSGALRIFQAVKDFKNKNYRNIIEGKQNELLKKSGDILSKGYVIKVKAYLYQLVWNDEMEADFYYNYWTTSENLNMSKKEKFDASKDFRLEYIGEETTIADLQSTVFTKKTNEELITIATRRATDKAIVKLQKEYGIFKTKTPLTGIEPLKADIGLKEGLTKKTKFEVLEQILNKDGSTTYKRIGQIVPQEDHIWDNQYLANEVALVEEPYTTFKIVKGNKKNFYPGLLIRQIK